jgi:hypothetical protein
MFAPGVGLLRRTTFYAVFPAETSLNGTVWQC